MTNKEAIDWLGLVKQRDVEFDDYSEDTKRLREKAIVCFQKALSLGIQALENQKIGHWIRWYEETQRGTHYTESIPHCKCSECNKEYDPYTSKFIKYCPECGAKMEIEE